MKVKPRQIRPPLEYEGNAFASAVAAEHPAGSEQLMERVVTCANLLKALKRVERNKGKAGVDGISTEQLRAHLVQHWPFIKQQRLRGNYQPQAVRRVDWIKRRLRSYLWRQWGKSGCRKLRKRGVIRKLAWYSSKSAHEPWRLSHSPALAIALPTRSFANLGLPGLFAKPT